SFDEDLVAARRDLHIELVFEHAQVLVMVAEKGVSSFVVQGQLHSLSTFASRAQLLSPSDRFPPPATARRSPAAPATPPRMPIASQRGNRARPGGLWGSRANAPAVSPSE